MHNISLIITKLIFPVMFLLLLKNINVSSQNGGTSESLKETLDKLIKESEHLYVPLRANPNETNHDKEPAGNDTNIVYIKQEKRTKRAKPLKRQSQSSTRKSGLKSRNLRRPKIKEDFKYFFNEPHDHDVPTTIPVTQSNLALPSSQSSVLPSSTSLSSSTLPSLPLSSSLPLSTSLSMTIPPSSSPNSIALSSTSSYFTTTPSSTSSHSSPSSLTSPDNSEDKVIFEYEHDPSKDALRALAGELNEKEIMDLLKQNHSDEENEYEIEIAEIEDKKNDSEAQSDMKSPNNEVAPMEEEKIAREKESDIRFPHIETAPMEKNTHESEGQKYAKEEEEVDRQAWHDIKLLAKVAPIEHKKIESDSQSDTKFLNNAISPIEEESLVSKAQSDLTLLHNYPEAAIQSLPGTELFDQIPEGTFVQSKLAPVPENNRLKDYEPITRRANIQNHHFEMSVPGSSDAKTFHNPKLMSFIQHTIAKHPDLQASLTDEFIKSSLHHSEPSYYHPVLVNHPPTIPLVTPIHRWMQRDILPGTPGSRAAQKLKHINFLRSLVSKMMTRFVYQPLYKSFIYY